MSAYRICGILLFLFSMSCSSGPVRTTGPSNSLLDRSWSDTFTQVYTTGSLTHVSTIDFGDSTFTVTISPSLYRSFVTPERLDLHTRPIQYSGSYETRSDSVFLSIGELTERFRIDISNDTLAMFHNTFYGENDDGTVSIKVGCFVWDFALHKVQGSFALVGE